MKRRRPSGIVDAAIVDAIVARTGRPQRWGESWSADVGAALGMTASAVASRASAIGAHRPRLRGASTARDVGIACDVCGAFQPWHGFDVADLPRFVRAHVFCRRPERVKQ